MENKYLLKLPYVMYVYTYLIAHMIVVYSIVVIIVVT